MRFIRLVISLLWLISLGAGLQKRIPRYVVAQTSSASAITEHLKKSYNEIYVLNKLLLWFMVIYKGGQSYISMSDCNKYSVWNGFRATIIFNRKHTVLKYDDILGNWASECLDNKDPAFFVVDNSKSNANAIATFSDISEEDCRILCSNNRDLKDQPLLCAAFTYDPNVFQCLIHDKKSIPDGTGIIINEPGKRYSEKFCIDADLPPECGRTQFIRVQQAVIVGYAKNFSSVSSTEECAMRCLKESFPCRSAMYFYEEGECITNSESAQTVPSAFAHEDTDKVIYFQNGCEKVVENQKNMISERQNDGEDIKLKNELESENPTNKDVINEEEAERDMNVELENRKPERVAIFKPEDKNDAKTESGEIKTSPVDSTHLVNMKNDGNPELPPEIKKLNHEENTNGSPEQVGVIPRVVYNEMVEEEKQIGGRKDSREDSMEQFRPHVVQPTIKEIPAKLEQQKHVKQVDTSEDEQRATTADSTEKKSTAAFEMPRVMIQVTVNSSNVTKKQNQVETTTMVVTTTKRFSENVEEATTAANIKNPKHDGQDDIKGLLKKSNRTKVDLENESRGYFSEWNPWTVCKTVGERRIRRRRCLNLRRCIGALTEVAVCKPEDIKSNLRTSPASSSSVRTIVSAGLRQPDEVTLNQWTNSNKHNVSVPFGVGSNQKITENPDLWSPWDGNCKQFPKIQPCRDHQQIGYESRECLKTNVDECIGPFFRYCTIPC